MPDDIADLRALSAAIGSRQPCRELDAQVHAVFCGDAAYAEALPAYTRDIDTAMRLVPPGWWFHFSHIEADVVPTTQVPGIPMSDSSDHGPDGRPVRYCSMTFGDRSMIALGICGAVVLAHLALALKADARARGRLHLVQTGHGPMMAEANGKLAPLPYGFWVDDEGRLVPRPTPSARLEEMDRGMASFLYILHGERPEEFPVELELTGTPAQELALALAGLDQAALLEGLSQRQGHTHYPLSADSAGCLVRATGMADLDNGAPYFRGGLFVPPADVVGWSLKIQVLHRLGRGVQTR